jgi:DNA-binding beta-propeller fold protein YncE
MLYVSDCKDHVVVELDKLDPQSMWKRVNPPWPAGALLEPAGVAVLEDGRLVIVDRGHHRLVVISRDRSSSSVLAPDGDPIGSLWRPTGVAIDPAGGLLIADTGNHRLVHCDSLDEPAWSCMGSPGFGVNQFVAPTAVAVDKRGGILIADPGAGRLVRVEDASGVGWNEIALPPAAAIARPYGASAGLTGVLVADAANARILLVTDNGSGGDTVTVLIDGAADRSLLAPIEAVDWQGVVYVADPAGASIARFKPIAEEDGGGWMLSKRLYGTPRAFPAPVFSRIGGFAMGASS